MDYEQGLERLRQLMYNTNQYEDFLIYEQRLQDALHNEHLYGPNEQIRSERAQIIGQLNRLARQVGTSFNDLCRSGNISNLQIPPKPTDTTGANAQPQPTNGKSSTQRTQATQAYVSYKVRPLEGKRMNASQAPEKVRILVVTANPLSTSRLALENEIRAIQQKIRATEFRDYLLLSYTPAAQPDDLLQAFYEHKPHIVHFSSHGRRSGEILLLDPSGKKAQPIQPEALKALFTALKDDIRLVFFNACYSRIQADAITSVVDCAIAMDNRISDEAAIIFAAAVYQAIGFGRSLQSAFDIGLAALQLLGNPEYTIPKLLHRPDVDPSQIYLVTSKESPSADALASNISHSPPAAAPLTLHPARQPRLMSRKNILILCSVLLVPLLIGSVIWSTTTTITTNTMHASATTTAQASITAATETATAACAAAPTLVEPVDGQTLSSRTVTFTWEAPQGCVPDGYTVRINPDYDADAKPWIVDEGWAPTDYTYTFSADGTYYWHIRDCKPCTSFHPGSWITRRFTIRTSQAS